MNSIKDSNIDSNGNPDRRSQLTPDTRPRIVNEIPESDLDKSATTNEKLAHKMLELKKLMESPEIDPELNPNSQNLTDMDPDLLGGMQSQSSTKPSQSLPMPLIKTAGVSGETQVQNNLLNPLQQQQTLLSPNNNINDENHNKNKQKEKQELASSSLGGMQSQFNTSPFQSLSMPVINQNYNSNLTEMNGPLLTGGMQSQSSTYPLLTPENLKSMGTTLNQNLQKMPPAMPGGPQVQNNLLNPFQQQKTHFSSGLTSGVSVRPHVQNNLLNPLQQKTPTQLSGIIAGVTQVQNNLLNPLQQQTSQLSSGLTGGFSGLTPAQQNILTQLRQRQDEHNLVQHQQIHMLLSGTTGGSIVTQAQYDPLNLFQQQQRNQMPFGMTGGVMEAQNNQLNPFQQKKENQPFGVTVGGMEALNNQLNLLQQEQHNSLRIQSQLNEMLDAEYKLMNMQKKYNLMSQQMQQHKQNGVQATTTTIPIIGTQPGVFVPTPEEGSSGAKLVSISAMPAYKDMSPDELRWAHYNNNDNKVPPPQQQQLSNVVLPPQQQQISNVVETSKGAAPPQHQPQLPAQQQDGNGKFKGLKEQEPIKNDIKFEVQRLESKMKEMERKQKYLFGGLFFMLVVIAVMVGIKVLGVDFFLGL